MANEIMIGDIGVASADPRVAVTRADTTAARNIEMAGAIAGDVVEGVQQARTRGAVADTAEALSATEQLITERERATVAGEQLDEAEAINRIGKSLNDRAARNFSKIRADLEQRGGGRGAAARRAIALVESEVRNISALTPGFSESIRQTAASVLGFDPTGATMERLFGMEDPEAAKAAEPISDTEMLKDMLGNYWTDEIGQIAFAYMRQTNSTPQVTMQYLQDNGYWQYANNMRADDLMFARGEQNQRGYVDRMIQNSAGLTSFSAMTTNLLTTAQIEGLDTLDTAKVNSLLDQWMEGQMSLAKRKGVVNQAELDRLKDHYSSALQPYRTLVSDTNKLDVLKENADTFQQMARLGLQYTAREFMTMAEGLNPALAKEVFNLMSLSNSREVFLNRLKAHPTLQGLFDEQGSLNAAKYFGGSMYSVTTGRPNPNPVPGSPDQQAAMDKHAAAEARNSGGMSNKDTSSNVQNADPKGTIVDVARNPRLGLSIPDGEAWDTFSNNFFAQGLQLSADLAADLYAQGATISVGNRERRTESAGEVTFSQVPEIQVQKSGPTGLVDLAFGPGTPKQLEVIDRNFAKIVENTALSRRLFNGKPMNREQYLNLVTQNVQSQINQMRMVDIEKEMDNLQKDIGRRVEAGTAGEDYMKEQSDKIAALTQEHDGLIQANKFANDQLRRYGMEVK